jgi:hypothetical protein
MDTAKRPASGTAPAVRAPWVRQTSSSGGSRETEVSELTVIPCGRPLRSTVVMTATAVVQQPNSCPGLAMVHSVAVGTGQELVP